MLYSIASSVAVEASYVEPLSSPCRGSPISRTGLRVPCVMGSSCESGALHSHRGPASSPAVSLRGGQAAIERDAWEAPRCRPRRSLRWPGLRA